MTNNQTIDGVCKTCLGSGVEYDGAGHACTACNGLGGAPAVERQPELTVWEGPMPESNGKSNFTAILKRKDGGTFLEEMTNGFTIARSEYPDRVRYEADCVRWLIGELAEEPFICDYDSNKHSGYVKPQADIPDVDSLQSTIARLEARIAELESGRGEPIYEQRYGGGWINIGREEYERCLADPEEESSLRIVFTATPAPAAVLPEFNEWYVRTNIKLTKSQIQFGSTVWQACLDATAALNGVKP